MGGIGIDRRRLLGAAAVLGAGGAADAAARHDGVLGAPPETFHGTMPWRGGAADAPPIEEGTEYRYFTGLEAAFVEAAVARLIPSDSVGPGAIEAGVPLFIDRQLAGPFGRGEHFYLGGPWPKGVPEQGYQSRLSPAQLYRTAIPAVEGWSRNKFSGKLFKQLAVADQDALLKSLESGEAQLESTDAKTFFSMLLQNTMEGYFSDPIYGGNRNMASWKMIGFPGAHYDYREWVSRHGERVPFQAVGIKGRPGWSET